MYPPSSCNVSYPCSGGGFPPFQSYPSYPYPPFNGQWGQTQYTGNMPYYGPPPSNYWSPSIGSGVPCSGSFFPPESSQPPLASPQSMYAPPTEPLMFSSFSPHAGTKWQAGGGRFPSVSPTAVAHIDGPQAPPAEPRNDDSVMEESIIAVVEDDVSWESPASPRLGVPQRSVWGLSEHYQRRLAAFTAPSFPFCCGYHPLDVELPIPRHLQCEYHEQQAEADYLSMESIAPDDETCFDITAANIDAFAASCCLLCGADSHSHLHCLFYASFSMDTAPPLLLFSEWEGRPYFLSPPPVTEGSSVMDAIDVLASIETEFKKDRSKVKIWWRGMCIYGAEEARNAEWFQPAVLLGGGSREEWEESQVGAVESYSRRLICDPNSKEDGSRGNGGPSYAFRVLSGDLLYITCPELEHPPSLRRRNACLDG